MATDRDTRDMFADAYIGTLTWYSRNHLVDEVKLSAEAVALFASEEDDLFSQSFRVSLLKRQASGPEQVAVIKHWIDARTGFDSAVRKFNTAAEGNTTASFADTERDRQSSETARERLSAAETELRKTFPSQAIPENGEKLIGSVQAVLTDDELVVDLMPSRYGVTGLIITPQSAKVRYYAISDVLLVNQIKAMRSALDP
jgi:hypothetical protein